MIKSSQKILYPVGKNDECITPDYAVKPILKYIPESSLVWCPFDTEDSNYVKLLIDAGVRVMYSHIFLGQDYYNYEPPEWDVMISNPPFTNKRSIFERALSFNKPFALLMSNTWLNDSAPNNLFREKDLQLLMFDKRIHFNGLKKITFSSSYFCWNFLPKQIIMEPLKTD